MLIIVNKFIKLVNYKYVKIIIIIVRLAKIILYSNLILQFIRLNYN